MKTLDTSRYVLFRVFGVDQTYGAPVRGYPLYCDGVQYCLVQEKHQTTCRIWYLYHYTSGYQVGAFIADDLHDATVTARHHIARDWTRRPLGLKSINFVAAQDKAKWALARLLS